MRGEVLHYDDRAGTGVILGTDGARYSFRQEDLKQILPVRSGAAVGFESEGAEARAVYFVPGAAPRPSAGHARAAEPERGLFEYFQRAFSHKYATFEGRARRKEYWGFHLFFGLIFGGISVLAILVSGIGSRGSQPGVLYYLVMGAAVIFALAAFLPALGTLVRRLHDIGLSGWVALIPIAGNLIPAWYINWAAIIGTIVIASIDSQPHKNSYGVPPKRTYG